MIHRLSVRKKQIYSLLRNESKYLFVLVINCIFLLQKFNEIISAIMRINHFLVPSNQKQFVLFKKKLFDSVAPIMLFAN